MKPYYSEDGIEIFHGDCREVIPALDPIWETVITDPVWPNADVQLAGHEDPQGLLAETLRLIECPRLAIQLGCDSDPRFLQAVTRWPFFRVAFLELARVGYKGRLLMTGDVAYLFGFPPKSREGAHVIPGRYMDPNAFGKQADHPCPRKLGHLRWLVKWWTDPDDVILDPFMGSGTTLLAAKMAGHRGVGIEIEEKYCDVAVKRLSQRVLDFA